MADTHQQLPRTLWIGIVLLLVVLCLAYALSLMELNHTHRPAALPVIGPVAGFTLTNQDGQVTTLADLTNRVWIADIIFTRCAGSCPIMSKQMESLQDALPPTNRTRLVTLTTDPDFDTPPVLKKYGERYGANSNRWTFLTGTKSEIGRLAANSLKLSAVPVKPEDRQNPADLFIHSTIFVIVDQHARLRGTFETQGDGVDWTNVQPRIIETVKQLEREK
jgi:cytochrome oxidase Cu insertion factor (SCO1/SenC/PrrC family)